MHSVLLRFCRPRLFALVLLFFFSLSLSPLPLFPCLLKEGKIRLTGHTPALARFFWSVFFLFLSLLPLFLPPVSAMRPSGVFGVRCLAPWVLGFFELDLRPFSGRLSAGRLVPSLSFVVFVFLVCCICGASHTRGADPSLHVA